MTDEEFEALYAGLQREVHAYASRRLGADAAHDVVSETFGVAWQKRCSFPDDPMEWKAWIFGIARNKVLTEIQRRARKHHDARFVEDWVLPGCEPSTSDVASSVTERDVSLRVYRELTQSERLLFDIAFLRGLTPTAGACLLGISTSTYTSRLCRLRVKITNLHAENLEHGPRYEISMQRDRAG